MRRSLRLLPLLFCALVASPSTADDFADFRIPEHRVSLWIGDVHLSGANNRSSGDATLQKAGGVIGTLGTRAFWLRDSDPSSWSISVDGAVTGQRSGSTVDRLTSFPPLLVDEHSEIRQRRANESWGLALSQRRYPWAIPVGLSIAAEARGRYSQNWQSGSEVTHTDDGFSRRSTTDEVHVEEWNYGIDFFGSAGLGHGRVRDATGVYEAWALEQRLVETGALARPLSSGARRHLVDLIYLREDYATVRDRPARGLWEQIEAIAREDGALSDATIRPGDLQRAAEPLFGVTTTIPRSGLPRSPLLRLRGHWIGGVLTSANVNQRRRFDTRHFSRTVLDDTLESVFVSEAHNRQELSRDDVAVGLRSEYHRPMGLRWQLDGQGEVRVPTRNQEIWLETAMGAQLGYVMADRWLGSAQVSQITHDAVRTDGEAPGDEWTWSYSARLSYYVQERTSIDLELAERQSRIVGPGLTPDEHPHYYLRQGQVRLGLTHRFHGRFDPPPTLSGLSFGGS